MRVEISLIIAAIGCAVGIFGWVLNHDKRVSSEARWRGEVNTKLDVIVGLRSDVAKLEKKVSEHAERICVVEAGVAQVREQVGALRFGKASKERGDGN